MSTPTILVAGTWGIDQDWWMPGSDFVRMLTRAGVNVVDLSDPFVWSTDLEGIAGKNEDWYAAGMSLMWYCHLKAPAINGIITPVNIIAHSHGGQVALYAAAHGLLIKNLITIATPERRDVRKMFTQGNGRSKIGYWRHLYSDDSDYMQVLGSWFDGAWGYRRTMPLADENTLEPKVGHTGLHDAVLWHDRGWELSLINGRPSHANV